MSKTRIRMFGVEIDAVSMDACVEKVRSWFSEPIGEACRYIVTPNVNHAVLLNKSTEFRAAYQEASLVLADGWPLVAISKWLGKPLPERVAGSDLVPRLLGLANEQDSIRAYFLGAAPGVGRLAAQRSMKRWPNLDICGVDCPPLGFESSESICEEIVERVNAARPDLLVVGLGAPKQELWLHRWHRRLDAKVAVAAGATIDFLAGRQRRAPRWVQNANMEWLFRIATDPSRLAGRYASDAVAFPRLAYQEWRGHRRLSKISRRRTS